MNAKWMTMLATTLLALALSGKADAGPHGKAHGYYGHGGGYSQSYGYRRGPAYGHGGYKREYGAVRHGYRKGYRKGYRHGYRHSRSYYAPVYRRGYGHYKGYRHAYGKGYRGAYRHAWRPPLWDVRFGYSSGYYVPYGYGGVSLYFGF